MKAGFAAVVAFLAAIIFISGCAAPGSKEAGFCSADSDCTYYWYAGGCYTPENMKLMQDEASRLGIKNGEARPIPGAYCTCELNKCVLNVP